jgi:uncharacterized protein (DUF305 family)
MRIRTIRAAVLGAAFGALLGGCRAAAPAAEPAPATPEPASAAASATAAEQRPGGARQGYTEADARFLQQMIGHHAQALAMTALVPARTQRNDLRLLAERIAVSQRDEIAAMQQWLRARGETVPAADAEHAHHASHGAMPGMLTAEEMAALGRARGADFERLFLELMIRHHEGAITMVRQLFATPGAGQSTQIFRIAADVEADQKTEIARMRALLGAMRGAR